MRRVGQVGQGSGDPCKSGIHMATGITPVEELQEEKHGTQQTTQPCVSSGQWGPILPWF